MDNRHPHHMREVTITPSVVPHAEGSCLIEFGKTRVICTASVEEKIPHWRRGSQSGWVTAEYGMLPRSTHDRTPREAASGKQSGRTQEIQRLIGRSLRSVIDMKLLGERSITLDCDVLLADGGTRTAAITGAWVALFGACHHLVKKGLINKNPLFDQVAAISCGIVAGIPYLDLDYQLDSSCDTDMNFVMTGAGLYVEIQGTAEKKPFSRSEFDLLTELATKGIQDLLILQKLAVETLT